MVKWISVTDEMTSWGPLKYLKKEAHQVILKRRDAAHLQSQTEILEIGRIYNEEKKERETKLN